MPLADLYRPKTFDEMVGQAHLVGTNGVLRNIASRKESTSLILYGPPGTGKTTAALILAKSLDKPLHKLNAVSASVTDIKNIVKKAPPSGIILYLDEIQYFNKKQQQSLLPYVEEGSITLIASTTENPYHNIYDALISRCLILNFERIKPAEVLSKLSSIVEDEKSPAHGVNKEVLTYISKITSGDVRRAITLLEAVANLNPDKSKITIDTVKKLLPPALMAGFDQNGDNHYAYISALQKSIRGSDPDAAVFWLTKLLEGGDIISPSRRLLVIASEDIGLANPDALTHTVAAVKAAKVLGLPEAYKPLTQITLYLALSPKSSSIEPAYESAQDAIKSGLGATTPLHLASEHAPGYKWAHAFPNHYVKQQYLPDDLVNAKFYQPGDNPNEQSLKKYWDYIKSL